MRCLPQLGRGRRRAVGRGGEVGDQAAVVGAVLAGHDHGLADGRVRRERRLDLAQLDAEAADLDLVVDPAEALERAVGPPAGEVAGAVEPRARLAGERVGDEPLGGQAGAAA